MEQDIVKLWNPVIQKINSINFKLSALNLPLSCRITALKTFCLSVMAFTARVAPIPDLVCNKITDSIMSIVNSCGVHFRKENTFTNNPQNGLGIPKIENFCSSLLARNMGRYLRTNEIWTMIMKGNFFEGLPDRSLKIDNCSSILKASAKVLCDLGIAFYNRWPNRAPLFYSPFLRTFCPENQLGGKPPDCPANMIKRASGQNISSLASANFSYEFLKGFLGFDPGLNFYLRLKGGMGKINSIPTVDGVGSNLCFKRFLGSRKNSKAIRTAINYESVRPFPFDQYLNRKLDRNDFESKFFFRTMRLIKLNSVSSFFFSLKLNRELGKAQLSHFRDIQPECCGCGLPETAAHMFFSCRNFQNCTDSLARVYGLTKEDLLNSITNMSSGNKIAAILMGACFFCASIFSKNGKPLAICALKNMALRFLRLASATDMKVKKFFLHTPMNKSLFGKKCGLMVCIHPQCGSLIHLVVKLQHMQGFL